MKKMNINPDKKDYFKAFIVGFFVPAFFLSIIITIFEFLGILYSIAEWDILASPVFFGFYNMLYFAIRNYYPIKSGRMRYGMHGAIIWVVISLSYYILTSNTDTHLGMLKLFGPVVNYWWHATAVFYWPIIGFIWFAYIQKPISEVLGLKV